MIGITVDLDGATELSRNIEIVSEGLNDLSVPLAEVTEELLAEIDSNFDDQGATFGEPWPERRGTYDWPMLQKTGELRRSFVSTVGPDEARIANSKFVGKKDWNLAYLHHYGTGSRGVNPNGLHDRSYAGVDPRTIMKIGDAQKQMIQKTFQQFIVDVTKGLR